MLANIGPGPCVTPFIFISIIFRQTTYTLFHTFIYLFKKRSLLLTLWNLLITVIFHNQWCSFSHFHPLTKPSLLQTLWNLLITIIFHPNFTLLQALFLPPSYFDKSLILYFTLSPLQKTTIVVTLWNLLITVIFHPNFTLLHVLLIFIIFLQITHAPFHTFIHSQNHHCCKYYEISLSQLSFILILHFHKLFFHLHHISTNHLYSISHFHLPLQKRIIVVNPMKSAYHSNLPS